MIAPSSIPRLLEQHTTLDLRGIDRLYLNAYQPTLQTPGSVVYFFKNHRQHRFASTTLMAPMTRDFVRSIENFARQAKLSLDTFPNDQRKETIAQGKLAAARQAGTLSEGVYLIGKAQEKCSSFRTHKRRNPETGARYGHIFRSTVMCNQYYFYIYDDDFGPLFVKFSSYFPYTARVCLNGHEYLKRPLEKRGIPYQALDNGVLSCADPQQMQQIMDGVTDQKIEGVFRKWLARLPHPFTPEDGEAGYRYELSILQAEFSRTQVFDKPVQGRQFFEQVIHENLDLGRPDQISLIFERRVTSCTPGRFRTRVITEGVIPSLHLSYKRSKIKQYFKEGRALRTETTINDPSDFGIRKGLSNLPALTRIGHRANERLLEVEQLSHDCFTGAERLQQLRRPQTVDGCRAASLRLADPRVTALLAALCQFRIPDGFSNRDLRRAVAQLLGVPPEGYRPNAMTYDLRRLRLHGLICRQPRSRYYRLTAEGLRIVYFVTRVHSRLLRTGLSSPLDDSANPHGRPIANALRRLEQATDQLYQLSVASDHPT
jgi:DNA-binding transcriptional ArsR family regulator